MTEPRITPGTRAEIGLINHTLARIIGLAAGGPPPNIFLTLARHRSFRPWLRFAGKLMPGGVLPRRDSELVILRVAHLCHSPYEWGHHERLGKLAGLTADDIECVKSGPGAPGWTPRQALLLGAVDALHEQRDIDDSLWAALEVELSEEERIELCLLAGHYEMLAMTLNALRVQPDPVSIGNRPWLIRAGEKVLQR